MTQAEKDVLTAIVAEIEKLARSLIVLEERTGSRSSPRIVSRLDTLRNQIDALPSN